mmetsp:Transcript_20297/g.49756  ORF Transcript_20297/g.49756 Transcript_20297/m.49756 type:complete len:162 (+) Transcript_20297:54-539(+)
MLAFVVVVATAAAVAVMAAPDDTSDMQTFVARPHVEDTLYSVLRHTGADGVQQRFACVFKWLATGGSSEDWTLEHDIDADTGDVRCVVQRPNPPSYLLFSSFELSLKTPKGYRVRDVEVRDNDGAVDDARYVVARRTVRNNAAASDAPTAANYFAIGASKA